MLATDLRYELVRSHVSESGRLTAAAVRRLYERLEKEGRRRLGASFRGAVRIRPSADMRYGEQIFEVQVDLDGVDLQAPDLVDQMVERFHARHEALYSYRAAGQEVVLVNVRLAVVGELPVLPAEPGAEERGPMPQGARRRVYLRDWVDVPVYRIDALPAGLEVKGPALFESDTTTVLVRDGERVEVTAHGWLEIEL
jgi:N-methylhydantoinase A